MARSELIVAANALEPIKGSTLFYPCSGNDLSSPLAVFGPYCVDFWFVDIGYFRGPSPLQVRPVLSRSQGYELVDVKVRSADLPREEWRHDPKYDNRQPEILTETYSQIESGRQINVHRHRRRGPSALRKEIGQLGVFFYRGDSPGESGSGTLWLTHRRSRRRRWLMDEVLEKLVDGGLIVTDGSQCFGKKNPYRELRRLHRNDSITSEEAVAAAESFVDLHGRTFQCVGCLGQHSHYGPTMVWQMRRLR